MSTATEQNAHLTSADALAPERCVHPSGAPGRPHFEMRSEPNQPLSASNQGAVLRRAETARTRRQSFLTRKLRSGLLKRLGGLTHGHITLVDGYHRDEFGTRGTEPGEVEIRVHSGSFYHHLAANGGLGAADSFIAGDWTCNDLPRLVRILCRNREVLEAVGKSRFGPGRIRSRLLHLLSRNTLNGSRRNIAAHYDLGNSFFELFLDPTMMYSAAMYDTPGQSLYEAQVNRLDHVCRELQLSPEHHLLEIGTGWGGLAVHAARNFGCRVTTTTISQNQYEYAVRRVHESGLSDRVTVLKEDYRALEGSFDRLISIEMIEAVGHQWFDTFFGRCGELLKPGGEMLIQAIVMPEQRYDSYLRGVDFIQKYIFPGGCLPSVQAMQTSAARSTDLHFVGLRDFADGYAETLRAWRRSFFNRLQEVREQGYTENFIRMWDYYLSYCEGAFDERAVSVVHARWLKP